MVSELGQNMNWPRMYLKSLYLGQYQIFFLLFTILFKKMTEEREQESTSLWAMFDLSVILLCFNFILGLARCKILFGVQV